MSYYDCDEDDLTYTEEECKEIKDAASVEHYMGGLSAVELINNVMDRYDAGWDQLREQDPRRLKQNFTHIWIMLILKAFEEYPEYDLQPFYDAMERCYLFDWNALPEELQPPWSRWYYMGYEEWLKNQ